MYALSDARAWNRSRDMEVLGVAVAWLRSMLDEDTDAEVIARSFPGYRKDAD